MATKNTRNKWAKKFSNTKSCCNRIEINNIRNIDKLK